MLNFSSSEYLPNSLSRIRHLQKIINGRPVAILAAGPSIKGLEQNINKLRDKNICYFGLNTFSVQENHILKKINQRFSVVMCSSREGIPDEMENIIDFLNREDDNIFISSFWRKTFELMPKNFDLSAFVTKYDSKLLFFSLDFNRMIPTNNQPLHFTVSNSLLVLIQIALIGKASSIVLFGADGYNPEKDDQYYHSDEYNISSRQNLITDTNRYFNPIAPNAIKNVYKTHGLSRIDILNCFIKSHYTPFPVLSYPNVIKILRGEKIYTPSLDRRVPVVSVITRGENKSLALQSYDNFEQVSSEGESRGKYMLFSPKGNSYPNQDWINLCVEILEKNPEISLVWGLTQQIFPNGSLGRVEDSDLFKFPTSLRGRKYFYTWLKRKIVYPVGNLCVRRDIYSKCFQRGKEAWPEFSYRFNTSGYLSYFIPLVANYRLVTKNETTPSRSLRQYYKKIDRYSKKNEITIIRERIINLCYNLTKWLLDLRFRL